MIISSGLILKFCDMILLCHVTEQKFWDIPKGCVKDGETDLDACLREVNEETNLLLNDVSFKFVDCGIFSYLKKKNLHLYLYNIENINNLPDIKDMRCNSFFKRRDGVLCPEVDEYRYIKICDISKYVTEKLFIILNNLI